jgi:hypothetical protein
MATTTQATGKKERERERKRRKARRSFRDYLQIWGAWCGG